MREVWKTLLYSLVTVTCQLKTLHACPMALRINYWLGFACLSNLISPEFTLNSPPLWSPHQLEKERRAFWELEQLDPWSANYSSRETCGSLAP